MEPIVIPITLEICVKITEQNNEPTPKPIKQTPVRKSTKHRLCACGKPLHHDGRCKGHQTPRFAGLNTNVVDELCTCGKPLHHMGRCLKHPINPAELLERAKRLEADNAYMKKAWGEDKPLKPAEEE